MKRSYDNAEDPRDSEENGILKIEQEVKAGRQWPPLT